MDPKAYPNPTTSDFTINFNVQSIPGKVEIYSTDGKLVFKDHISEWIQLKYLNISGFPNGIYSIRLISSDHQQSLSGENLVSILH